MIIYIYDFLAVFVVVACSIFFGRVEPPTPQPPAIIYIYDIYYTLTVQNCAYYDVRIYERTERADLYIYKHRLFKPRI